MPVLIFEFVSFGSDDKDRGIRRMECMAKEPLQNVVDKGLGVKEHINV